MLEQRLLTSETLQRDIKNGDHWRRIAERYGITLMSCLDKLQLDCVNAVAVNAVRNGEGCQTIAMRYGIITPGARAALEEHYLERTMADIRAGDHYRTIAARYGMTSTPALSKLITQYVTYHNGNLTPL
ncbi:hypothetical protein ABK905_23600 [Acerihabitans sp. KWT182]|uniref:Mor transcription activator domain-containing protein n=1 Tax=Acerihabitans sp. KWT182 TaxID=3157919 RepID=A0AAU7Q8H8_9GAMM